MQQQHHASRSPRPKAADRSVQWAGPSSVQMLHCPRCQGKGKHIGLVVPSIPGQPWYVWLPCEKCHGTGYLVEQLAATKEVS